MGINWSVETFDTLASTMDIAHERAEAGIEEGCVISAIEQTSGRGRRGSSWIPQTGNLYFSLVLRSITLKDIGQYSFIAAVALADIVTPRLKSGNIYKHKWPNDGLVNDRKFAGILLESGKTTSDDSDYLIIGVGINIVSAPDDRISFNEVANERFDRQQFLDLYLERLGRRIGEYRSHGFAAIRADWLENAKGLYNKMTVRLPNETFEGVFDGLDGDGALLLGLDNGLQKVVHSGEVFFGKDI